MSKIGVGVGDDFPLDDGNGGGQGQNQGGRGPDRDPGDDRAEFEDWKRRRDARRAQQEAWQRQREEWRARKRAFKERMRRAAYESFGNSDNWHDYGNGRYGWHPGFWPIGFFGMLIALLVFAIPILAIVLFFSLISAAFKAPFLLLAILAILVAGFAVRHHFHRHRWHYHAYGPYYGSGDYDLDLKPRHSERRQAPQQPPSPPQNGNGGPIVPPPPASGK